MDPDPGPGWRAALRHSFVTMVPGWRLWLGRRSGGSDGLVLLRGIFLSLTISLVLVGVVVVVLVTTGDIDGGVSDGPVGAAVVLVGAAGLAGSRIERPLQCEDDGRLAGSYTTRFFLRVALAEASALVGFVAFVLTGSAWMYPLGTAFTAVGFWRLAPTSRHLQEDEARLGASGCSRSLVAALRTHPPGRRVSRG